MHLGPFCYCLKLGANRADRVQLMEKFVQQGRIRIFRNEGTLSKSLDFWILNSCPGAFRNVWVDLGLFHYCTKLSPNWVELVQLMQKFVQRSRV